jgi:hypothetical protein
MRGSERVKGIVGKRIGIARLAQTSGPSLEVDMNFKASPARTNNPKSPTKPRCETYAAKLLIDPDDTRPFQLGALLLEFTGRGAERDGLDLRKVRKRPLSLS